MTLLDNEMPLQSEAAVNTIIISSVTNTALGKRDLRNSVTANKPIKGKMTVRQNFCRKRTGAQRPREEGRNL